MTPLLAVEWIVLHSSLIPWGSAAGIDRYHRRAHPTWAMGGYHWVIENGRRSRRAPYRPQLDGRIVPMRPPDRQGAGAFGFNRHALHICLIGKDTYTEPQVASALRRCGALVREHDLGVGRVIGHGEIATLPEANYLARERAEIKMRTCPGPGLPMAVFRTRLLQFV